jgi:hypothetical protein
MVDVHQRAIKNRLFMRAMMALVLHLGGVGECVRLIWE